MPTSPWDLISEDLFVGALFPHFCCERDVLAKARLVNRHWRQLVDEAVSELEPRQRITEPHVSQMLSRFTGLTSINVGEPWRLRITDESVPALLVRPPPPNARLNTLRQRCFPTAHTSRASDASRAMCSSRVGAATQQMARAQGLTRLRSLDVTPLLSNDGLQRLAPLAGKLTALQYAGHAAGRSGGLSDDGAQFIGQVRGRCQRTRSLDTQVGILGLASSTPTPRTCVVCVSRRFLSVTLWSSSVHGMTCLQLATFHNTATCWRLLLVRMHRPGLRSLTSQQLQTKGLAACRQAFTALQSLDVSRCPQLGAGVGGFSALTELRALRLFEISKLKDSALRQALPHLTRRDGSIVTWAILLMEGSRSVE